MSAARKLYWDRSLKELKVGEAVYLRDAEDILGPDRIWALSEFQLPHYEFPSAKTFQEAPRPTNRLLHLMRFTKTIVRTEGGSTCWVWVRTE